MTLGVAVRKEVAEKVITLLKKRGLLNTSFKIKRSEDLVIVPVVEAHNVLEILREAGIEAFVVEEEFEKAPERPRPLSEFSKVSSYSVIGDIAVFSWRSYMNLEEYKTIAQELIRQQPRIKAVFLKTETWGDFRVQRLVHLAGEERTWTVHKEYGLLFYTDIAKVYFNPRLSTEHRRIAEESSDEDLVFDMFAGVGGYSIHIANLRRAKVLASDLNEIAVYYLTKNVMVNKKALRGSVFPIRLDASIASKVLKPVFTRLILDSPTASLDFLGETCRLASSKAVAHVYVRASSCKEAVETVLSGLARCCKRAEELYCREVLEYAPGVSIYNASFTISGVQA